MELSKTTKQYHRYRFEQKLPLCLRHNLTKVTIHDLINSRAKGVNFRRSVPPHIVKLLKVKDSRRTKVERFIIHAFSDKRTPMIRVVFNRFLYEFLIMVRENKIKCTRTHKRAFKIYNYEIIERKGNNTWFNRLENKLNEITY